MTEDREEQDYPHLTREQAFDIAGDMELDLLRIRGFARALLMASAAVTDKEQRDGLDTIAWALEDEIGGAIERREQLWHGLNPVHDREREQTP